MVEDCFALLSKAAKCQLYYRREIQEFFTEGAAKTLCSQRDFLWFFSGVEKWHL